MGARIVFFSFIFSRGVASVAGVACVACVACVARDDGVARISGRIPPTGTPNF